jgi:1-aminocyclopropane-1-carboxylate deaminase/D-cysteine desulfhydrase-like pyridoxal-dependent ACC family enzyme
MKGSINVSLQTMPLKTGVTVAAVLFALQTVENPIPVFKKRTNKIKQLVINTDGKDTRTIMLENIEDTAVKNMEEQYTRMYVKVGAGIAVKAAASVATGLAAKKIAEQSKKTGQFAGVIGLIAGAGTGAALVSQIQPDLRCWHSLPANLQIGRLFLNPGKYNISIKFIDQNGAVEQTKENKFEIKTGEKIFLNYRTLY